MKSEGCRGKEWRRCKYDGPMNGWWSESRMGDDEKDESNIKT